MGIYDYMNHFWFENENDPCSLSEGVLYFYLLYEANRQHWASPFKVSTQMLAARLNTSKQNVMKARDGLRKRGLIDFSKAEGKGKPALYTLRLSEEQSQSLSQLMTHSNNIKIITMRYFYSLCPSARPKICSSAATSSLSMPGMWNKRSW